MPDLNIILLNTKCHISDIKIHVQILDTQLQLKVFEINRNFKFPFPIVLSVGHSQGGPFKVPIKSLQRVLFHDNRSSHQNFPPYG